MSYLGRRGALAPVNSADIPDNSITSAKIVDGAVAVADLGPNSVDSSELVDGSIDTSHIGDDQVTGAKIENNPTIAGNLTVSGDLVPATPLSHRNHLINGDFQVAQRATSFTNGGVGGVTTNNDDEYTLDRWYILSDTDDVIDVTQSSTAPTNQKYSIALDVEKANKKFGIAQIIENKNCVGLIGNNVTFSFQAKVSATTKLDNVKAGIIAWSSTADAVTSDVVSAWGIEGTNPTLASNLTFENTPANLSVTTSWATYSVSANIDTGSTTNVIVFIWSDVTDTTAGDFLYITDCQLERGSNVTPFERRNYVDELEMCQRYSFMWHAGSYFMGTANGTTQWAGSMRVRNMHHAPAFYTHSGGSWAWRAYQPAAGSFVTSTATPSSTTLYREGFVYFTVASFGTVSNDSQIINYKKVLS